MQVQRFIIFLNNQKKQPYNFLKEQQKFCNQHKFVEYNKVNVKLTDAKLKNLKAGIKNKTGTTLRMSLKMFDGNNLPHEILLTTGQKAKLRNTFNNNVN